MWGHESLDEGEREEEVDAVRDGSDGMRTSSSDDGLYVKSSMYLHEVMVNHNHSKFDFVYSRDILLSHFHSVVVKL